MPEEIKTLLPQFSIPSNFLRFVLATSIQIIRKQESPPVWMQEAYRPPCSKYSLCCPNWVPPQPGYPPAGYPLARVPPGQGTPWQGTPLAGYPPRQGTPPARVPPHPPGWTWQGTPPAAPWHSGKCCKALWDMGTPPWTDRLMDGRTDACQNITFPSYYVRGR